jgi:hypothetical protein
MDRWHLKDSWCLSTLCPLPSTQMGAWPWRSHLWGFAHCPFSLQCSTATGMELTMDLKLRPQFLPIPKVNWIGFSHPTWGRVHVYPSLSCRWNWLIFSLVGWGWRQSSFRKDARQLLWLWLGGQHRKTQGRHLSSKQCNSIFRANHSSYNSSLKS